MSFLFEDNQFLSFLLKQAQAVEEQGSYKPALDLAQPLIVNLQRAINPEEAAKLYPVKKSISFEQDGIKGLSDLSKDMGGMQDEILKKQRDLFPKDMRTLGDFLTWAANNKIIFEGKRLSFAPGELNVDGKTKAPPDAWSFQAMTTDRQRGLDNQPIEKSFLVAKKELLSYLEYLRDSKESKDSKVFQVMLGAVIKQVNEKLVAIGDTPIVPKLRELVKSDLDPNAIVDGWGSDVFDLNNPLVGIDAHPFAATTPAVVLRVKDLLEQSAFFAWLNNKKIATKEEPVGALSITSGDPCGLLHLLYKRARALSTVAVADDAIVPGYSKMVALYLQSVQNFGKQIKDKDGNACSVIQPGIATKTDEVSDKKDKDGNPVKTTSEGQELFNRVASKMPLRLADISFARINNFLNAYKEIVDDSRRPYLSSIISKVQVAQNEVKVHLADQSKSLFELDSDAETIQRTWLKQPPGSHYLPTIRALGQVIDATKEGLTLFKTQFDDLLTAGKLNDTQVSWLYGQIGRSPGENSIATRNLSQLNNLQNMTIVPKSGY